MMRELRPAFIAFLMLTILTGIFYPMVVTGIAKVIFPWQAEGSVIRQGDKLIGAENIGQSFSDPKYFWGRPSATSPQPYNAAASSGSNQGPTNPALVEAIKSRIDSLHLADPYNRSPIPVDLVTASGSGLDPHISPAAAGYQLKRVAGLRGLSEDKIRDLVKQYTETPQLGILGEPRVNVLKLNLALDNF